MGPKSKNMFGHPSKYMLGQTGKNICMGQARGFIKVGPVRGDTIAGGGSRTHNPHSYICKFAPITANMEDDCLQVTRSASFLQVEPKVLWISITDENCYAYATFHTHTNTSKDPFMEDSPGYCTP